MRLIDADDTIREIVRNCTSKNCDALWATAKAIQCIETMPSAQPEYEPVEVEDFAKTMSENSLYNFVAWHQEALTLMKEHGFVICKKTM